MPLLPLRAQTGVGATSPSLAGRPDGGTGAMTGRGAVRAAGQGGATPGSTAGVNAAPSAAGRRSFAFLACGAGPAAALLVQRAGWFPPARRGSGLPVPARREQPPASTAATGLDIAFPVPVEDER